MDDPTADFGTPNGLRPDFQLTDEQKKNLPNFVFPVEKELVSSLRSVVPRAQDFPLRLLLAFLFARKHDLERTVEFLNAHIDMLDAHKFPYPSIEVPVPIEPSEILAIAKKQRGFQTMEAEAYFRPGLVDKEGRILMYQLLRHVIPGEISAAKKMKIMTFWWYTNFESYSILNLRNGMTVVMDIAGAGLKNLDYSSEGQKLQKSMLNMFPGRMRAIYIINSNWLVSVMLKFGRLMFKDKLMDRIEQIEVAQLRDRISVDAIPYEYGGEWLVRMDKWLADLEASTNKQKKLDAETDEYQPDERLQKLRRKALKSLKKYDEKTQKKMKTSSVVTDERGNNL